MQKDRSKHIVWRLFIVATVGFIFLEFSGLIWMELGELAAHPFNLIALASGILGPALAIAAIIPVVANKYLPLATLFAITSLLIFAVPLLLFMFGVTR
jgi:hypothetical protein